MTTDDLISDFIERHGEEIATELDKQKIDELFSKIRWQHCVARPKSYVNSIDSIAGPEPTHAEWQAACKHVDELLRIAKRVRRE